MARGHSSRRSKTMYIVASHKVDSRVPYELEQGGNLLSTVYQDYGRHCTTRTTNGPSLLNLTKASTQQEKVSHPIGKMPLPDAWSAKKRAATTKDVTTGTNVSHRTTGGRIQRKTDGGGLHRAAPPQPPTHTCASWGREILLSKPLLSAKIKE